MSTPLPRPPLTTPLRHLLRESWRSWLAHELPPRGPAWLQWFWTLVFCAVLAVGFTIAGFFKYASGEGAWRNLEGWWHWYKLNLFMCVVIGALIHLMFDLSRKALGSARINGFEGWQRALYFSGVPLLGVAIGWPLAFTLLGASITQWFSGERGNMIVGSVLLAGTITYFFNQFFQAKARQIAAERRATESQLQLLQAQIEPHFLFNTLANVLSLIDSEPARARRMLEAFTDYLRASLGEMRRSDVTLAEELQLATAYLQVQQMRMDERLRFTIEADADARAALLPPLLVQPLIENAVAHGLEPKVEGGRIVLRARRESGRLVIEVDDDGLGLEAARHSSMHKPGNGVALTNIRERLEGRFGSAASLTLSSLSPGTRCRIELPHAAATAPSVATPGLAPRPLP